MNERILLSIRAGERLLQRAEDAKCRGDIKDYRVIVSAADPRIIDSVVLIR